MQRLLSAAIAIVLLALTPGGAHGQASMRLRYDAAQAAGPDGDGTWYRDRTNADALLAWGTSYAMMSFLVMYRATGEARYLDRLAYVADGVLAQRDSERGVTDYRGESEPCWQSTRYSDGAPYCWAVHDGMILFPMVELAVEVERDPALAERPTHDGQALGDKRSAYVQAGRAGSAVHDRQWRDSGAHAGYYIFPSDADFTARPGEPMPLNQMNAIGRLQIALCDATGEAAYCERARRLANYLRGFMSTGPTGGYAWNYWPEPYSAPGEDVSHAAINVGFAARAARSDVVFDDSDLVSFGTTFFDQVYLDQRTSYDHVGGTGATNGSSYRPQLARWLVLDAHHPALHAAVRDIYAGMGDTTSGSVLLGMAQLAATDRFVVPHRFYRVDWRDEGDYRKATAYGANVLITPPDPDRPALLRLRYRAQRRTEVQQWDGDDYHTVARLAPTGGDTAVAHVPYAPRWYHDYGGEGVLYQFADEFVAGEGIEVFEAGMHEPPRIETTPPEAAMADEPYVYEPTATGGAPRLWSVEGPSGIDIDPDSGRLAWTAESTGTVTLELRVENDYGFDTQRWELDVGPHGNVDAESDAGAADLRDAGSDGPTTGKGPGMASGSDGGCACTLPGRGSSPGRAAAGGLGVLVFVLRRRRRD